MPFSSFCKCLDHTTIEETLECEDANNERAYETMTLVASGDNGKTWRSLDWNEIDTLLELFGYMINPNRPEYLVTDIFGYPLATSTTSHMSMTDADWTEYEKQRRAL